MPGNFFDQFDSGTPAGPVYGAPPKKDPYADEDQTFQRNSQARADAAEARAREAEDRAQQAADRQAEQDRRSDLEWKATHNPDGTPKQAAGGGKMVPDSAAKRIEGNVGTFSGLASSAETFKSDYAGNPIGGLENWAQQYVDVGTEGQRDWWANFKGLDNQIRNDLFGAALTATEKKAYEQTTVEPSMRPEIIRENLQRRTKIIESALGRQREFMVANGYKPEAVDALFLPLLERQSMLAQTAGKEQPAARDDATPAAAPITGGTGGNGPSTPPGGGSRSPEGWTAQQAAQFWGTDVYDEAGHPLGRDGGVAYARDGSYLGVYGSVTDDDGASPLPTDLIAEGRAVMDGTAYRPNDRTNQSVKRTDDLVKMEGDQSGLGGIGTLAKSGITLGLSDEAAGVGGAAAALFTGGDPTQAYYENRNAARETIDAAREAHPTAGAAAEFLGSMAGAGVGNLAAAVPTVGQAARAGATLGGVQGFGAGNGLDDTLSQTAISAGAGGALGAGLQKAAPYIADTVEKVASSPPISKLRQLIDRQRSGAGAPRTIVSDADELGVTMLPADVGGVGSRMLSGALGRTLGGIPLAEGAERSVASAAAARSRIASEVGDVTDPAGAGQAVRRGFSKFTKDSKARADELYSKVSIPAESKVELANTKVALAEITRGMESNPELSKLWVGHPRLRESLEALTPTDTRAAGQVQFTQAADRLRGAEEAVARAKDAASRNHSFEQDQARDALGSARETYDRALSEAREQAVAAQNRYAELRPQVVSSDRLVASRQQADVAQARFDALARRDRENPQVAKLLKPLDDAEETHNRLRYTEPSSDEVGAAQKAMESAKRDHDDAFVLSRQAPQGGELSWKDINRFRSVVGEIVGQPGVSRDGSDIAALRKLYGALSSDMEVTAAKAGPKALTEFNRAAQFWRGRENRIDEVFQGLFGNRDQRPDEAVFKQINTWAQGSLGDFSRLARTIRSLPQDEANAVRATVIERMGVAKKGQQNAAGDVFSPAEFVTQWNGLSPRAKSVLFSNKQHREDLDKFAGVMANMKKAGEYQNFSNTALGANLAAVGLTGMTGSSGILAAAAYSGATFSLGKLMASPRFARLVAKTTDMPVAAGARDLAEGITTLATREPAISADIRGLQDYLRQTAEGLRGPSLTKAAADDPDEKKKKQR